MDTLNELEEHIRTLAGHELVDEFIDAHFYHWDNLLFSGLEEAKRNLHNVLQNDELVSTFTTALYVAYLVQLKDEAEDDKLEGVGIDPVKYKMPRGGD